MNSKELYKTLCETEGHNIPLFLQYWWMDTVCHGKQWDVALALDRQGNISAAMPYLIGSKMGLRYVLQPQLTQYSGPWFRTDCDQTHATRQLCNHFRKLRLTLFNQNFAPSVTVLNGWEGYRSTPRITYRIEDIGDPQQVFAHFDKRHRQRQIRHCEHLLHPVELSPTDFAAFHTRYWQSRGEKDLLSSEFMTRVIGTAQQRNQGLLLGLQDDHGILRAARFVAYDSRCAYSLLSALHPEGHPNGASPLLFWHMIAKLSSLTRSFDFEGSMVPSIAYSYSLYGAQPTTYFQLTRCPNPLLRALIKKKL